MTRLPALALIVALTAGFPGTIGRAAPGSKKDGFRGGRVDWARLVTPNPHWAIHSDHDASLAKFIREQTTLNIDAAWYSASPANLEELCTFPFIYAKDLSRIPAGSQSNNLREYLLRGGFLCIDACGSPAITPDGEAHFQRNCDVFKKLIPGVEIRTLTEEHEVYRSYFQVTDRDMFTRDMGVRKRSGHDGLYGVFSGERMVALLSMHGLQCGWPQTPLRTPGCMKMIVNIYVYAMTADAAPPTTIR